MGIILSYSLLSALVMTIMFIAYKLFMSNEKNLRFNRCVFLSIYVVSLLMPLAWLMPAGQRVGDGAATTMTSDNISTALTPIVDASDFIPSHSVIEILLWLYITGAIAVLAHTVMVTVRILHIVRSGECIDNGQCRVILIDDERIAPFSWINCIVMPRSDYHGCGDVILKHEMMHICSYHWVDLYVAQMFVVFQWYNPAAWMMHREIRILHEFEADDAVVASGVSAYEYQMLLVKKAVGARFPSLADSLNHSQLKKRVNMMSKKRSSRWSAMRSFAFVPAVALAALLYSTPAVASFIESTSQSVLSLPPDDKDKEKKAVYNEEEVFTAAEAMPQYPGGELELLNFVSKNVKYPEKAAKEGTQGQVVAQFVVTSKGKVVTPKIVRSVSPEIDAEAIRVLSLLPDFKPGTVGGKPVAVWYTIPIRFRLSGDKASQSKEKE
ncbi:MAG: M56 family metallopeptidase [Muribaculaceae bacterium]|nr:M56 family metallopeptidase [Muribaculaceae bacterium]